jgi:hypothetical protein
MSLNKSMGDKHEDYLHKLLGGRKTKGSGNQWQNPADGRHSRYEEQYAFAWDGKSTFAKSLSITRSMLDKIKEQASPEEPLIGVRFYDPEAGERALKPSEDWILVPLTTFAQMLKECNRQPDPYDHSACPTCECF